MTEIHNQDASKCNQYSEITIQTQKQDYNFNWIEKKGEIVIVIYCEDGIKVFYKIKDEK